MDQSMGRSIGRSVRRIALAAVLASAIALGAAPAQADRHDIHRSGHPMRVAAYILYPVGLLIDTIIFRPAHWVVNHEPFKQIFGHTE